MSNQSLTALGTNLPFSRKSVVSITYEKNILCSKTRICRQVFVGLCGKLMANETQGKNISNDKPGKIIRPMHF